MTNLPIPHYKQRSGADCLAACSAMVLDYFGIAFRYRHLLKLLEVTQYGALRSNIRRLESFGLKVSTVEGNLDLLASAMNAANPVVCFINTAELDYWSEPTDHAVVVVGMERSLAISLLDPFFDAQPIQVNINEFMLAWLETDYNCAVIEAR